MTAVGDRARRKLHERLEEVLGDEAADTLMAEIDPRSRDRLATRDDLQAGLDGVRSELGDLRSDVHDLRSEFGDLRSGFSDLRSEFGGLRSEMATLELKVERDLAGLRAEVHEVISGQTRQLGVWILGSMTTLTGLVLASSRL